MPKIQWMAITVRINTKQRSYFQYYSSSRTCVNRTTQYNHMLHTSKTDLIPRLIRKSFIHSFVVEMATLTKLEKRFISKWLSPTPFQTDFSKAKTAEQMNILYAVAMLYISEDVRQHTLTPNTFSSPSAIWICTFYACALNPVWTNRIIL